MKITPIPARFMLTAKVRELESITLDALAAGCRILKLDDSGNRQELTARIVRAQKRNGTFDYQQFD